MATTMPIPLPPRTPTPPPDEPSPQRQPTFDPVALSAVPFNSNALSPHHLEPEYMASSSVYMAPMTPEKQTATAMGSVSGEGGQAGGPFNFQPATLAKSPVIKSVRCLNHPDPIQQCHPLVVTSTK